MNGRCTADPLDHADDICEFCGDEFCRSCLIQTRGGKGQQICRDCAIRNSGIKGTKSTKTRPTKSQLEKARKALAEAKGTRNAKTFEFFDEAADYVPRHANEEAPAAPEASAEEEKGRGTKRRFARRRKDDQPSNDGFEMERDDSDRRDSSGIDTVGEHDAPPPPAVPTGRSTPATTLIESGALTASPSGNLTPPPAEARQLGHDVDLDVDLLAASPVPLGEAVVDAECFEGDADDEWAAAPASEDVESPSSLADRLRNRPIAEAPVAPSFVSPTHQGHTNPARPPVDELPVHASLDADPFAIADHDAAPTSAASLDVAFPSGSPAHVTPPASTFDWQSSHSTSSENLNDDPFSGSDPFTEPVAVIATVAPVAPATPARETAGASQRAADQFVAPPPDYPERRSEPSASPTPESPSRLVAPAPHHLPEAAPPIAAPHPTAGAEALTARPTPGSAPSPRSAPVSAPAINDCPATGAADTDANGNWIPPLLRGMAPVAERRAAPLPKRRAVD